MNLQNLEVRELSHVEKIETEGGIIGLLIGAFVAGVAYGYVKEKFASGDWSIN